MIKGAIGGALAGFSGTIGGMLLSEALGLSCKTSFEEKINKAKIGAVVGAGFGAMSLTATSFTTAAMLGGASNVTHYIATSLIFNEPITLRGIAISLGTGGFLGGFFGRYTRSYVTYGVSSRTPLDIFAHMRSNYGSNSFINMSLDSISKSLKGSIDRNSMITLTAMGSGMAGNINGDGLVNKIEGKHLCCSK